MEGEENENERPDKMEEGRERRERWMSSTKEEGKAGAFSAGGRNAGGETDVQRRERRHEERES